jgi:hypothetical protein
MGPGQPPPAVVGAMLVLVVVDAVSGVVVLGELVLGEVGFGEVVLEGVTKIVLVVVLVVGRVVVVVGRVVVVVVGIVVVVVAVGVAATIVVVVVAGMVVVGGGAGAWCHCVEKTAGRYRAGNGQASRSMSRALLETVTTRLPASSRHGARWA